MTEGLSASGGMISFIQMKKHLCSAALLQFNSKTVIKLVSVQLTLHVV